MPTIDILKEQEAPPTPLFLVDCTLSSGSVERWSTHALTLNGNSYSARLLKHNLYDLRASSNDGLDGTSLISLTLANADSHFSQLEREIGFKGAQVTIQFVFYDLAGGAAASESRVMFHGVANPPEEITESAFRVSFNNRFNLQRIVLPEVQILRRCPWMFPSDAAQRQEALNGGAKGKYSSLYKCGYSPDLPGGAGNLNQGVPFTFCDFSRSSCIARGMFSEDSSSNQTARFGGLEFVPAQIVVRSFGEKGSHASAVQNNLAIYNDYVPVVYGTAWYLPPIVFARNDGNLTRMEVLLGLGEIESVLKVLVNDIDIPEGRSDADMTATGWFNVTTPGTRNGAFDPNFTDVSGNALGDPYGSMAMMSVVVPNRISDGSTLPSIRVLMNGLKLEQFDSNGNSVGESFTNNPAWVILDVLRRSGWITTEIDLTSFATAASYCAQSIQTVDLNGNSVSCPRYQCNLVISSSRSASEIIVGIRNGSALILSYGNGGLLTLQAENTIALQQPSKPDSSNSTEPLAGGWPAYEFSDASAVFSGLARKANGDPAIRLWAQSTAATPNRLTVEFQDEFNEYQQDSLSLVDVDDALLTGRQVTGAYVALGLPNFDQAARALQLQLRKSIAGYTFIDFETSVRGIGLAPGDIITVTYLKEGLERQPFRIVRLSPGQNFRTLKITAQWHDDGWYSSAPAGAGTRRQPGAGVGLPRPLVGSVIDENGLDQFGITETSTEAADGTFTISLSVAFHPPSQPAASGVAIPLVSLNAAVDSTGGSIAGGQNLYYAISAMDGNGTESGLSFVVPVKIASGSDTNTVTISGLSFSTGTGAFNVYRGINPLELLQVAVNVPVAATYTDAGAIAQLEGPPDENYDHANFYWRLELQPETSSQVFSATTIGNNSLGMIANEFKGAVIRVMRGTGAGQERSIIGNSVSILSISPPWTTIPDTSSFFVVADATWNFGGLTASSPAAIVIPNQTGATVQVTGRSANALDQESAPELNPLTRWQIGGAAGGGIDADVPPAPAYGLSLAGQGTIELGGVGFPDLTNTHTISTGTLTLFYWDELSNPTTFNLASMISATDTAITLNVPGPAEIDDLIQIEGEILEVVAIQNGGTQYQVGRGSHTSTAAAHAAGSAVYHLRRNVSIGAFFPDFFGSPASGNYTNSIFLPDVRIGAAELFVTNVHGNSPVAAASFGATTDYGLRTLSGGQLSLQVEGYLAIQTDAAPPLVVESSHATRDISAIVREAPSGGPVQLQVRQGNAVYCTLTIPDGATGSNLVNGSGLPPLIANAQLSVDILSVPGSSNTLPGRDLTVTVRL